LSTEVSNDLPRVTALRCCELKNRVVAAFESALKGNGSPVSEEVTASLGLTDRAGLKDPFFNGVQDEPMRWIAARRDKRNQILGLKTEDPPSRPGTLVRPLGSAHRLSLSAASRPAPPEISLGLEAGIGDYPLKDSTRFAGTHSGSAEAVCFLHVSLTSSSEGRPAGSCRPPLEALPQKCGGLTRADFKQQRKKCNRQNAFVNNKTHSVVSDLRNHKGSGLAPAGRLEHPFPYREGTPPTRPVQTPPACRTSWSVSKSLAQEINRVGLMTTRAFFLSKGLTKT